MLKVLVLILFALPMFGQIFPVRAPRWFSSNSAPTSGCSSAADTDKIYIHKTNPTTDYRCKQTGVSTFAWVDITTSGSGTGTPGGSNGQLQYRVNSTDFGGMSEWSYAGGAITGNSSSSFILTAGKFRPPNSSTLPATCTAGDIYVKSDAATPRQIYICTASNTWTQQGVGNVACSAPLVCSTDVNGLTTATVDATVQTKDGEQSGASRKCSTTGTSTQTCSMSPALLGYTTGMVVEAIPASGISGATTINIDSLGAKSIKQADGSTAPAASQVAAGQQVPLRYDGTVFRLPPLSSSGASTRAAEVSGNFISTRDGLTAVASNVCKVSGSTELGANVYTGGSYVSAGVLEYTGTGDKYQCTEMTLPSNWSSGSGLTFSLIHGSSGTTGQIKVLYAGSTCTSASGNIFEPQSSWTNATTGTAGKQSVTKPAGSLKQEVTTWTLNVSGCAAGDTVIVKWGRVQTDGSDNLSGTDVYRRYKFAWTETLP